MTNLPMPGPSLPGDVSDVGRIVPNAAITPGEEKVPMGQPFSTFMQEGKGSPLSAATSGKAAMVSPFELAGQGMPMATSAPTLDSLMNQVNMAQSTLGDLNTHMNSQGLKLKSSQKYLLKNKLSDANTHLRVANSKMGAMVPEAQGEAQLEGPFAKFLKLISDGQKQMDVAQTQLQSLKDKGTQLSPADFLLIQINMNRAQNELEYSSVLLSNAVGAIKQMMQIQL